MAGRAGGTGDEPNQQHLDELAKGPDKGSFSRLQAPRLMGGTLVGGLLAFIPGSAWTKEQDKCKKDVLAPSYMLMRGTATAAVRPAQEYGRDYNGHRSNPMTL